MMCPLACSTSGRVQLQILCCVLCFSRSTFSGYVVKVLFFSSDQVTEFQLSFDYSQKILVNANRAFFYLICSVLLFVVLPFFEILVASVNVLQIGEMRKFFYHSSILSAYTLRSILS